MLKISKNGKFMEYFRSGVKRKYLVAYSEYNESEAFWLPESKIFNALEIFNDNRVFHG